ncbi:MAG: hypothetical protein IT306_19875 [Chloroflexi bacterium]|nr:hypothetical protein [Chloroflexota bacterium]
MFQLWDMESANLLGSYTTEDAALHIVRQAIDRHGAEVVATLLLLREDAGGQLTDIAESAALAKLALSRTTPAA